MDRHFQRAASEGSRMHPGKRGAVTGTLLRENASPGFSDHGMASSG
jgi:hypothetical protein